MIQRTILDEILYEVKWHHILKIYLIKFLCFSVDYVEETLVFDVSNALEKLSGCFVFVDLLYDTMTHS